MRMMRLALALSILAACGGGRTPVPATPAALAAPAAPAVKASPAELEHIDVFGSKQLGRDPVLARWGDRLAQLVRDSKQQAVKEQIEAEIAAAGRFAYVRISTTVYFPQRTTYVIVDLVDVEDRARRMKLDPEPGGLHADPDGLIALWNEYSQKAWALQLNDAMKPEPCPAWHCIAFFHAPLASYHDAFARRVPAAERALVAVLREDRRPDQRAAAAFLLAYLASGERVVERLLPSITDPSELVRNNAMRVLGAIASDHPEIAIPVAPIIEALHFPSTTDRNKAAVILDGLTRRTPSAELREQILAGAGEILVDMLALRQPNNHDFAYRILKQVSGRDLGEHAVDAWRAWLRAPR